MASSQPLFQDKKIVRIWHIDHAPEEFDDFLSNMIDDRISLLILAPDYNDVDFHHQWIETFDHQGRLCREETLHEENVPGFGGSILYFIGAVH